MSMNRYIPSSTYRTSDMPPSLTQKELMHVKQSLLQHCGFMTDKALLNDLLCSLDEKLRYHQGKNSSGNARVTFNSLPTNLPPTLSRGSSIPREFIPNNFFLTKETPKYSKLLSSYEYEKKPVTMEKQNVWNSPSSQKRLSSTPMSKAQPLVQENSSRPAGARSLNDSLSFSAISSPQSCFTSPFRASGRNENFLIHEKNAASELSIARRAPAANADNTKEDGVGESLAREDRRNSAGGTVKPTKADNLLELNAAQLEQSFLAQPIGSLESNCTSSSNAHVEYKVSENQFDQFPRSVSEDCKTSEVSRSSQRTSSKQLIFASPPDILSTLVDISEVSECYTDSQATISGPSLVSEVAKLELPSHLLRNEGSGQNQWTTPDEETGANPFHYRENAAHENEQVLRTGVQQLIIGPSKSASRPTYSRSISDDAGAVSSNTAYFGRKMPEGTSEPTHMTYAQVAPRVNVTTFNELHPLGRSLSLPPKISDNFSCAVDGQVENFISLQECDSCETVSNADACEPAFAFQSKASRDLEIIPKITDTAEAVDSNLKPNSLKAAFACESAQTRENVDALEMKSKLDTANTSLSNPEKAGDETLASGCERAECGGLEAALQHERQRCEFLLQRLVEMEEQCLQAQQEKIAAQAAVAELQEMQKALLDLHCCEAVKLTVLETSSPRYRPRSCVKLKNDGAPCGMTRSVQHNRVYELPSLRSTEAASTYSRDEAVTLGYSFISDAPTRDTADED